MNRLSLLYLLAHYLSMILLIFLVVVGLELAGVDVPLWLGVALAIGIGLLYPKLVVALDIAPEQWG